METFTRALGLIVGVLAIFVAGLIATDEHEGDSFLALLGMVLMGVLFCGYAALGRKKIGSFLGSALPSFQKQGFQQWLGFLVGSIFVLYIFFGRGSE